MSNQDNHSMIVQLHTSLGLNTPSNVTVTHMSEALESGHTTVACVRASLIRSDAYRISVRTRFRDACYSLLGEDDDDAFRCFDLVTSAAPHREPIEVTEEEIDAAVKGCAKFEKRYIDLVRRNYSMLMNGEQPSEAFTTEMLDRFRYQTTFTLEDLHNIVRAMPPHTSASHTPSIALGIESSTEDITCTCTCISSVDVDGTTIVEAPVSMLLDGVDIEVVKQILLVADREFSRPWYALEIIAYIGECARITDGVELLAHMSSILSDHNTTWEKARIIHQDLLGDTLDEIDFVRKYVGRHRGIDFASQLKEEILNSPIYEQRIKARILVVQKRLYDIALDTDEIDDLFDNAKASHVGVGDDYVSLLLHDHRRQCDALVSEIVRVYVDVLSREPDHQELEADLREFRASRAIAEVATQDYDTNVLLSMKVRLSVRLSKGYEFHDVIKARLRSAYHQASGGIHVPMQMLYTMLERVLSLAEGALKNVADSTGLSGVVNREIAKTLNNN